MRRTGRQKLLVEPSVGWSIALRVANPCANLTAWQAAPIAESPAEFQHAKLPKQRHRNKTKMKKLRSDL